MREVFEMSANLVKSIQKDWAGGNQKKGAAIVARIAGVLHGVWVVIFNLKKPKNYVQHREKRI